MTVHDPALVERIEKVVGAHECWQRPDHTWECACGKRYGLKVNLDLHVAVASLDAILTTHAIVERDSLSTEDALTDYYLGRIYEAWAALSGAACAAESGTTTPDAAEAQP